MLIRPLPWSLTSSDRCVTISAPARAHLVHHLNTMSHVQRSEVLGASKDTLARAVRWLCADSADIASKVALTLVPRDQGNFPVAD
jgi:hypothetical protein